MVSAATVTGTGVSGQRRDCFSARGLRGTQEAVWSRMEEDFRGVGMELGRTEGEELGRSWEEGSEINR